MNRKKTKAVKHNLKALEKILDKVTDLDGTGIEYLDNYIYKIECLISDAIEDHEYALIYE